MKLCRNICSISSFPCGFDDDDNDNGDDVENDDEKTMTIIITNNTTIKLLSFVPLHYVDLKCVYVHWICLVCYCNCNDKIITGACSGAVG